MPDSVNTQCFNRYMYALGNPVKFLDPTGHESESGSSWSWSGFWSSVGAFFSYIGSAISNFFSGNSANAAPSQNNTPSADPSKTQNTGAPAAPGGGPSPNPISKEYGIALAKEAAVKDFMLTYYPKIVAVEAAIRDFMMTNYPMIKINGMLTPYTEPCRVSQGPHGTNRASTDLISDKPREDRCADIHSISEGVVKSIQNEGESGGFGKSVQTETPEGNTIRYSHLDSVAAALEVGSIVHVYDSIGIEGHTGTCIPQNATHLDIMGYNQNGIPYNIYNRVLVP